MHIRPLLISDLRHGELIPAEEFHTRVQQHYFTDNDGFGYYLVATPAGEARISVDAFKPSFFKREIADSWVEFVIWFNK